jgi:beta-lactam-binding protein with PASTA domain
VEVPDVTELSLNDATRRLESLGLVATRRDLYSITTPKDTIIHQYPEPKTVVSQGATITLSVSLGAELPAPCPPKTEPTEEHHHGADSKKTAHAAARRG